MRNASGLVLLVALVMVPAAKAEFRSAKDMQKECRVALQVCKRPV